MSKGKWNTVFFVSLLVLAIATVTFATGSNVEAASKKKFKVGVSNGPFTHSWRVQMIESVQKEFEFYREQGLVSKLTIQNAGTDVNTQIAQIRNLIASGIDLLLIIPNSATALNPVIEEAQEAGITVIVYEQPIDNPNVLNVFIDQKEWMGKLTDWFVKKLNGTGDVVYLSGIPDQPISIARDKVAMEIMAEYPNIKVLTVAPGYWSAPSAQQAMTDILASFPKIDGVLTQDGQALGIVRAFQAAGRALPIMTGDHQVNFIKEWKKLKDERGFESYEPTNPPGEAVNDALGIGLRLLQGKKLKPEVVIDNHIVHIDIKFVIDNSNIDRIYEEYKDWADSYYVNHWYTQEELDQLFQ
jgi:ABC-type sugar transport system substrate-binding protein